MILTRDEKIAKIYEVIADKTLNFGCWCLLENWEAAVFVSTHRDTYDIPDGNMYIVNRENEIKVYPKNRIKEIWHKVMIWDVLDWWEKADNINMRWYEDHLTPILSKRKYKRKPIDEQSDECINYVYDLLRKR